MIVYPNAKINLGLNIVSKRPDEYHNLETVFYPVNLTDTLSVEKNTDRRTLLEINGIAIEGKTEDNTVMKAYRLLEKEFNLDPVTMKLIKNIPSQAGLGGGSSDAAFAMKALNQLFNLKLTEAQMEKYVAGLGADCPFFVKNKPVFAEGTGNIFTPVTLSLKGYTLLLIKPAVNVSTRIAFQNVHPHIPETKLTTLLNEDINMWKDTIVNDFEDSIFPVFPVLADLKEQLYRLGAVYASMSGSGSSLYGLFKQPVTLSDKEFSDCFCRQIQLQ